MVTEQLRVVEMSARIRTEHPSLGKPSQEKPQQPYRQEPQEKPDQRMEEILLERQGEGTQAETVLPKDEIFWDDPVCETGEEEDPDVRVDEGV